MELVWDEKKNEWLKAERLVSFEEISNRILEEDYIDIVKHPHRANQRYFVLHIYGYTWLVPFLIDEQGRIILKTAFPSRKYHKKYGDH